VLLVKFVQDIPVEDKDGDNGKSSFQCMVEAGIIIEPKVSPEPENIDGIGHMIPNKQRL
jgi:hypothetical protein